MTRMIRLARKPSWFLIGMAGIVAISAGCRHRGSPLNAVILITLDTTRADRIGCYVTPGADTTKPAHLETPTLDRFAAENFLFLNAVTPVPLTCPAHTTIMTGLYPQAHGVTSNETTRAGLDLPLLAVDFHNAGYTTAAFLSGFVLQSQCGLGRGFDHYADISVGRRRAGETTDAVLQWLDRGTRDRRLFLWVHYYDPHAPYDPPADIKGFEDSPYDGEIAYMDRELGRLLDGLRKRGLDRNAVIAIVGDHGEGLGDHGEREHGIFLYEETQHVPLMIRLPERVGRRTRRADRRIPEVVGLADLRPTLAGLAKINMAGEEPQGRDLYPLMMADRGRDKVTAPGEDAGGRVILLETLYPEVSLGWSRLQGLRGERWKYIKAPTPELYDLKADPRERNNLAGSLPDTLRHYARLHEKLLRQWSKSRESAATTGVEPETARMLRSLGYLAPSSPPSDRQDLPDPKKMIGLLQYLEDSKSHAERQEWAKALEAAQRMLQAAPDNFVALFYTAIALAQLERREESNALYETILKKSPQNSQAQFSLGENLIHLGRHAEAIPHLEQALADATYRDRAHWLLSVAFEARGDLAAAYEHASAAAAAADGKSRDQALRQMGLLSVQLGRMDHARQEITQALKAFPDDADLHMSLGEALGSSPGQEAEAEKELRRAIELAPEPPVYHYNLACILARQGKGDEAVTELTLAVRLGYANREGMRSDPDLSSLRESPGFLQLLKRVGGKAGH